MIQIERLLAHCLDDLERGDSVEECLARYPRRKEELEPLLRAAQRLRSAPSVIPAASFRQGARARLLEEIKARTVPPEAHSASTREGLLGRLRLDLAFPAAVRRLALPALATASIVLLLGMTGLGLVHAASESLPGDPLYAVKRAGERVRLTLTLSEISDAKLHLTSAGERLEEAAALLERGRGDEIHPLMEDYAAQVRAASRILRRQRVRGMDVTSLSEYLSARLARHEAILSRLREEVSEEARVAVEKALAASRRVQQGALEPKGMPVSSATPSPTSTPTVTSVATESPAVTHTPRPTETKEPRRTAQPDQEPEPTQRSTSPGHTQTPKAPGPTRTPRPPDPTQPPQRSGQTSTPRSSQPTKRPPPAEQGNTPESPGQGNTPQSHGDTKAPQPPRQTKSPPRPGQTKTP